MARYKRVKNGEWVQPRRHRYKLMCCDCGLVHVLNFRLVRYAGGSKAKIQFQATRHERATGAARRYRKANHATD